MKLFTRSVVVLATLGLVAAPAVAGKRRGPRKKPTTEERKPVKRAPRPIDYGESFDLSRLERRMTLPAGDAAPVVELRGLSEGQVGAVVKDRLPAIEYCWLRLPAGERTATTAVLTFAIDSTGEVSAAGVRGVPGAVERCISEAAAAWTFPGADVHTDAEYAIELR